MFFKWVKRALRSMVADWNTVRVARRDGGGDPAIPHWDAEMLPPVCWAVLYSGLGTVQQTVQQWLNEDKELHAKWDTAFHEAGHAHNRNLEAESDRDKAEVAYKAEKGKDAPPTDRRFLVYWIVGAIWSLLEVPFTAIAFRVLGDSDLLTYIITAALSVSIIAAGHFLGKALRHRFKFPETHHKFNTALAIVLAVINVAVLLGIAFFRAHYLSRPLSADVSAAQPLGLHEAGAFSAPTSQEAAISELPALIIFFAFGLLLFIDMAVFAFNRHDPLLDTVFRRRKNLITACRHKDKTHRDVAHAKTKREKRHAHYAAEATWNIASVRRLVELYKQVNLQVRKDRGQSATGHYPLCFDKHSKIDLPVVLTTLEWTTALAAPVTRPISSPNSGTKYDSTGVTDIPSNKTDTGGASSTLPVTSNTTGTHSNGHQPNTLLTL